MTTTATQLVNTSVNMPVVPYQGDRNARIADALQKSAITPVPVSQPDTEVSEPPLIDNKEIQPTTENTVSQEDSSAAGMDVQTLLGDIHLDEEDRPIFEQTLLRVGSLYQKILQFRQDKRENYRQIGREINEGKAKVKKKYRADLVTMLSVKLKISKDMLRKASRFAERDPDEISIIPSSSRNLSWRRICTLLSKVNNADRFKQLFADHPNLADLDEDDFKKAIGLKVPEKQEVKTEKNTGQAEDDSEETREDPPEEIKTQLVEPLVKLNEKIAQEEHPWRSRVRILSGLNEGSISIDMTLESYEEYKDVITYLAANLVEETAVIPADTTDEAAVVTSAENEAEEAYKEVA